MSKINLNELINLEIQWKMEVKKSERESKKTDAAIKSEKKKAEKRMSEGKVELARMHVQRSFELEDESVKNQKRITEMSRLATQVYDFRKTVEQAQMMSRATMGMNRLEKQMDLAKLTSIMDEYKEKIGNVGLATGIFNDASANTTAVNSNQEAVDRMMEQLADSQGVDLRKNLDEATPVTAAPVKGVLTDEQEAEASERFKALRNAA